jgi:hypothetical protein
MSRSLVAQRADLACLAVASTIDGNAPPRDLLSNLQTNKDVRAALLLNIATIRKIDSSLVMDAIEQADLCEGASGLASVDLGDGKWVGLMTAMDPRTMASEMYVQICSDRNEHGRLLAKAVRRVLRESSERQALEAARLAMKFGIGDQQLLRQLADDMQARRAGTGTLRFRCAALMSD